MANLRHYGMDAGSEPEQVSGYEETLRLIANLPAPEGLAGRLQRNLNTSSRRSTLLAWPSASGQSWMHSPWMRTASAAAIVCAVAAGGWGVLSHFRPPVATASPDAARPAAVQPGFSTAGAMRTPQTLAGPKAPLAASKSRKPTPAHHPKPSAAGRLPLPSVQDAPR